MFEAEGWQPNVSSWNILLMAHAKAHDCSAAWATFEDMARGGGRPDEGTWVALITCHARKARGRGHAVADARVMQVFGKSPVYPRKEKYTQEKKSIPKKEQYVPYCREVCLGPIEVCLSLNEVCVSPI